MKKSLSLKKLTKIKPSGYFCVENIPEKIKYELIRLGISEGDILRCIVKIPFGPVVIEKDLQEIAIGEKYACLIEVSEKD